MRGSARLAAAALLAGLPAAAEACGVSPNRALIHSALPAPLPEGVFIAEVEIDLSTMRDYGEGGVRAEVKRVVQGDPQAVRLILRSDYTTSCDAPLANGAAGLILGLPRGREGEALIVHPIAAHRNDGFRLTDGFSVRPECRDKPCRVEIIPSPTPARPKRRR